MKVLKTIETLKYFVRKEYIVKAVDNNLSGGLEQLIQGRISQEAYKIFLANDGRTVKWSIRI